MIVYSAMVKLRWWMCRSSEENWNWFLSTIYIISNLVLTSWWSVTSVFWRSAYTRNLHTVLFKYFIKFLFKFKKNVWIILLNVQNVVSFLASSMNASSQLLHFNSASRFMECATVSDPCVLAENVYIEVAKIMKVVIEPPDAFDVFIYKHQLEKWVRSEWLLFAVFCCCELFLLLQNLNIV